MARSMGTRTLTFGLVSLPVSLYVTTDDHGVKFNQLNEKTGNRINYRKVDAGTGNEVPTRDIVAGYDLGSGEYVVVSKEDIKACGAEKTDAIGITEFVDIAAVDPLYFERTYYIAPKGGSAVKAYELLHAVMRKTGKAAIATIVMSGKERLVALRAGDGVLLLHLLYFAAEIRATTELNLPAEMPLEGRELEYATLLVDSLTKPWAPENYVDTLRPKVEALIEAKHKGNKTVFASAETGQAEVIDLMAALQASVAAAKPARKPRARKVAS